MKRKVIASIFAVVFAVALALPSALTAEGANATPRPYTADAQPLPAQQGSHPEIRDALRHLYQAETNLSRSAHDFGGHRQKAIDLIHQAQQELNAAIAYADSHRGAR